MVVLGGPWREAKMWGVIDVVLLENVAALGCAVIVVLSDSTARRAIFTRSLDTLEASISNRMLDEAWS